MRKYNESIENVTEELGILNEQFGDPINIDKYRASLIADWYPFVGDNSILELVSKSGTHTWEYAFFLQIKQNKDLWDCFICLYEIFKKAKLNNPQLFSESFKFFWDSEHKAIRDYSDHFHLERGKNESPDLLSVKVAFQEIGFSLESCIQPFAKHYLALYKIAELKNIKGFNSFKKMSFGNVINQLSTIYKLNPLYKPQPWNISINQWRNISYHSSFEFDEKTSVITCSYGVYPNTKHLEVTYPEILYLCYSMNLIFGIHKMAYAVFSLGIPEILRGLAQTTEITFDSISATVTEILTTHSFKIVSFSWKSAPWQIELIDQIGHSEKKYKQIINELYRICSIKEDLKFELHISLKDTDLTRTITIGPRPTKV